MNYSAGLYNNSKTVGIHCPVDVYLYNRSNNLVLSVVNEKIETYSDNRIAVNVCNEQKAFCYPADEDYRILSEEGDSIREIESIDISLTTNQTFTGNIPYNHTAQTKQFELKTNGNTIKPSFDSFNTVKSVSISDITINYKKSAAINPIITADEGVTYTVKYESSNPKVATVDQNGNVYGAKKGSADIKVTVTDSAGNTVTDTCNVKVKYSFGQWLIVILLFGWIWY